VSDTELTAIIPTPFGDNNVYAKIKVLNPPRETGGLDGNFSNVLTFEFPCKTKVVINVDNKTKKYGQPIPGLTADIQIKTITESVDLAGAVALKFITQEELSRISQIQFITSAESLSEAGKYLITTAPDPLVRKTDAALSLLDAQILEKFIFEVHSGTLTVEKLNLTITPKNKTPPGKIY